MPGGLDRERSPGTGEGLEVERISETRLRQRRLIHTVLLLVIVATLPCYCAGAILLGLARDGSRQGTATLPAAPTLDLTHQDGPTSTHTLLPTITPLPAQPLASPTPPRGGTLVTPGQFVTPPATWTPQPPTATWTLPPTATVFFYTSTPAPTVTFTFTWTPTVQIITNTPPATATTEPPTATSPPTATPTATSSVPTATTEPPPTPTQEELGP